VLPARAFVHALIEYIFSSREWRIEHRQRFSFNAPPKFTFNLLTYEVKCHTHLWQSLPPLDSWVPEPVPDDLCRSVTADFDDAESLTDADVSLAC